MKVGNLLNINKTNQTTPNEPNPMGWSSCDESCIQTGRSYLTIYAENDYKSSML